MQQKLVVNLIDKKRLRPLRNLARPFPPGLARWRAGTPSGLIGMRTGLSSGPGRLQSGSPPLMINIDVVDGLDPVHLVVGSRLPAYFPDLLQAIATRTWPGVTILRQDATPPPARPADTAAGSPADAAVPAWLETAMKADCQAESLSVFLDEKHISAAGQFVQRLAGVLQILRDKHAFQSLQSLTYSAANVTAITPHNRIEVSAEWLRDQACSENEPVLLLNLARQQACECSLQAVPDLRPGSFRASRLVTAQLDLNDRTGPILCLRFAALLCDRATTQNVGDITAHHVTISAGHFQRLNPDFGEYQLIHLATGAIYPVPVTHIKTAETLAPQSIQLSYFQRQLLHLYLPVAVPHHTLRRICQSDGLGHEDQQRLTGCYANEKLFTTDHYQEAQELYRLFIRADYEKLLLVPCLESYHPDSRQPHEHRRPRRLRRSTWPGQPVADFFIGASQMTLECLRPYMIDEDKDIVRLSEDNMVMLGVQETDRIIIRYRNRTIRTKVLRIDSIPQIRETNVIGKDAMIDTMIGIPVHLRRRLNIPHIHASVQVERDTGYLFMKNANKQFLPILALLFTLLQTFSRNIYLVLLLFVSILPIVIYIVFSEERSKIK